MCFFFVASNAATSTILEYLEDGFGPSTKEKQFNFEIEIWDSASIRLYP